MNKEIIGLILCIIIALASLAIILYDIKYGYYSRDIGRMKNE